MLDIAHSSVPVATRVKGPALVRSARSPMPKGDSSRIRTKYVYHRMRREWSTRGWVSGASPRARLRGVHRLVCLRWSVSIADDHGARDAARRA